MAAGKAIDPESSPGGLDISVVSADPSLLVLRAAGPGYTESFAVATTDRTVTIVAIDTSGDPYQDPRIYHLPRPLEWLTSGTAEDLLLQIWQVTGNQR